MKIVAIGGYLSENPAEESFNTPILIDEHVVAQSGKKHPDVLFLSTASSDEEGYVGGFYRTYEEKLGCHVDTLKLVTSKPTDTEIRDNIERADIIYVGGGNTLKMMNLWRRHGIDALLRRAAVRGTVLAGESAGSICWFRWGVSDSRQYYHGRLCHEYIRVSGLGLLPGAHSPHFGGPKSRRDRDQAIKTIMQRTPGGVFVHSRRLRS